MRNCPNEQRVEAYLGQRWTSPQRWRMPLNVLLSILFSVACHLLNDVSYNPRATVFAGSLQPSGSAAPMVQAEDRNQCAPNGHAHRTQIEGTTFPRALGLQGVVALQPGGNAAPMAQTDKCESMSFTHAHRAPYGATLIPMTREMSMERHMRTREAPLMNTNHTTQNHNGVNLSKQLVIIEYIKHSIRRITNHNNHNIHKTTKLDSEAKSIDESFRSNVPLWRLIAGNRHSLPLRIRIASRGDDFSPMILRKEFDLHTQFDGLLLFSINQIIELIYYRIHAVHTKFNFVNVQTVFIHDASRSHLRVHRYPPSSLLGRYLNSRHRIDWLSGMISLHTDSLISVHGLATASAYSWVADYLCRPSFCFLHGLAWLGDTPIKERLTGILNGVTLTSKVMYAFFYANATTRSHFKHPTWLEPREAIARTKTDNNFFTRLNFSPFHDVPHLVALGYRNVHSTTHWLRPLMLSCSSPLVTRIEARPMGGLLSLKHTKVAPYLEGRKPAHLAFLPFSYSKSYHVVLRIPQRRQSFDSEDTIQFQGPKHTVARVGHAPVATYDRCLETIRRIGQKKPPAGQAGNLRENNGKPIREFALPLGTVYMLTTASGGIFQNTRGTHHALGGTLMGSATALARETLLHTPMGLHLPLPFPHYPFSLGAGHTWPLIHWGPRHSNKKTCRPPLVLNWMMTHGPWCLTRPIPPANANFVCVSSIEAISNEFYLWLLEIVSPLPTFNTHSYSYRGTDEELDQARSNANGLYSPHALSCFYSDLSHFGSTNTHGSVSFNAQLAKQYVSNNAST